MGGLLQSMLPFLAIIAVFYFLILRPQTQKQKEHKALLESLEKGDDVVTIGGIHGKIVGFKSGKDVLILKIDNNVNITVDRSAVQSTPSGKDKKE